MKSLSQALHIKKGETLKHPIFGNIKVIAIYKTDKDYDMYCSLLGFKNTMLVFSGIDLARLKFKRRPKLKVIKNVNG
jgi:prophage DNA circulation protein